MSDRERSAWCEAFLLSLMMWYLIAQVIVWLVW